MFKILDCTRLIILLNHENLFFHEALKCLDSIHNTNEKKEIQQNETTNLVLNGKIGEVSIQIYCSFNSLNRLTAERTVAAAVVEYTQAPPATVR